MKQRGRLIIDFDAETVSVESDENVTIPLNSPEAFSLVSDAYIRCGWDTKYVYSFSWLGRPIIQLPDDMMRIQEVVYQLKPDLVIETGVAHGGSLIFYASLFHAIGHGKIVGVDVEIRSHNRKAIEEHVLSSYITLIEGDSVSPSTIDQVETLAQGMKTVLILLDSCHSKEHVLKELEAYSPFVSVDSYIVAMDGIMGKVVGAPRTQPDWDWNNPEQAALDFAERHKNFVIEEPKPVFNEGQIVERVTYWPKAFLRRTH